MPTLISIQATARAVRSCLLLAALVAATSAAAQSPVRSIDVSRDGDAYIVKARMFAPVSQAIAWGVLTDFGNMAGWVPNLQESAILKQGDKQMTIEQKGTAKFHSLSFSYTSVRDIVLNPQTTIQSTQVKGSMKKQQSLMTLGAEGDGTRMDYQLEIVPSLLASAAISPDFLKHEIEEQFTAIVGEMVKRKK